MTGPIRLSKRLAELTACSRREAELYIGAAGSASTARSDRGQFKVLHLERGVELLPVPRKRFEPATLLPTSRPAGAISKGLLAAGRR